MRRKRKKWTMEYELAVSSAKRSDLVDITSDVQDRVRWSGVEKGICAIFVPHTTAGLVINENWDPSVRTDILAVLDRLVPWQGDYHHTEGNAAAHIKAVLVGASATLPVEAGRIVLGRWQGIFMGEFDGPRQRRVLLRVIPDIEAE